ncbi:MAG TPA: single-stranded-DNA-specific exonuclease RecJ [Fastidiosipila sp.]|nr:single-stranded-DNA-specific exonuclease RecJ [Fastidiosipila sp.]
MSDVLKLIQKSWKMPPPVDPALPLWARILSSRGYDTDEKRRAFLEARPLDPFLFSDMKKTVQLLHQAIENNGRIMIFGDYDADGLTATAILIRFFEHVGVRADWLIPDRLDEGYGISAQHVEQIIAGSYDLVITVDCGSNSVDEVKRLKDAGMKVIVSDHHVVEADGPFADAHLNPRAEETIEDLLSGAGVAYLIVEAYVSTYEVQASDRLLKTLRILAMVGTVADIMPLVGANRHLVQEAFNDFSDYAPPGLKSLVSCGAAIDTTTVAFRIAPSLNAATRLGETDSPLLLLLTDSVQEAALLSERLRTLNEKRREVEALISKEAISQADRLAADSRVIVVRGKTWHTGVIGIVAARLVERYSKPAIVLSYNQDEWQGSARSYPGIDLHGLLTSVSHHLIRFGGHQRAAGLSLSDDCYDDFCLELNEAAATLSVKEPELEVDAVLLADDLQKESLLGLSALEPCGEGNPEPRVVVEDAEIFSIRLVGQGKHTRLDLIKDGQMLTAMCFRCNDLGEYYVPGDRIDVYGRPSWNVFNGRGNPQIIAFDVRPSETAENNHVPSLEPTAFEHVYRMLVHLEHAVGHGFSPSLFAKQLSRAYNRHYTGKDIECVLDVLADAGMIRMKRDATVYKVDIVENPARVVLSDTTAWQHLIEKGWLKSK